MCILGVHDNLEAYPTQVSAPQHGAAANTSTGLKNDNLRTEMSGSCAAKDTSYWPRLFHLTRANRQPELQRKFRLVLPARTNLFRGSPRTISVTGFLGPSAGFYAKSHATPHPNRSLVKECGPRLRCTSEIPGWRNLADSLRGLLFLALIRFRQCFVPVLRFSIYASISFPDSTAIASGIFRSSSAMLPPNQTSTVTWFWT